MPLSSFSLRTWAETARLWNDSSARPWRPRRSTTPTSARCTHHRHILGLACNVLSTLGSQSIDWSGGSDNGVYNNRNVVTEMFNNMSSIKLACKEI
jgi:hypothetical protein